MPQIPDSHVRGKKGEYEVAGRLCYFSDPRPPMFDVGIDFFCELKENRRLSGRNFYVQVKSTKEFDNHWICSIKKETVLSWLNQKFPVFLIVYEESSGNCYWSSVEDNRQRLIERLPSKAKTVTIRVDRSNILEEQGNNARLIRKVKTDGIKVNASQGIPEFISEGGYVGIIPALSLNQTARERIAQTVRSGLDYLIYDRILNNDFKQAYTLFGPLALFD